MTSHPLQGIWNSRAGELRDFELRGVVSRVHNIDGRKPKPEFHRKVAALRREPGGDFVDALGHGISLLECWSESDQWLANSDIAARSGLTKSTVSRLASVLVDLGYLSREFGRGRMRLTAATLELGFGSAFAAEPVAEAHPELTRLANDLDVYAALSIRRLDKVQVLDNVASPLHPDAVVMDVGGMLPICRSASGFAAFSALPDAEATLLMERMRSHYGPRWETLQRQLIRTKEEFSSKGYCTSVADLSRHVAAVAIPIVPASGGDVYVIGCGMSATEFHRQRVETEIVPQMQRLARYLAQLL
jgi:DNA-binding IclR family transcriptional regulator